LRLAERESSRSHNTQASKQAFCFGTEAQSETEPSKF
jgi:hypothetical protein